MEWWRPEKPRISAAGSVVSRSDSDTSCRAATQPSVLAESRATSSPRSAQPVQVDQERACLVDVEAQRRGVDLGQLLPHPQPGERQPGPGAAGQDQRQVRWREVEHVHQCPVHRDVVDQVPVVDGQHDPAGVARDELQQRRERVALGVLRALFDQLPQVAEGVPGLGERPAHGVEQVRQEPVRLVVVAVQPEPRDDGTLVLQYPQPLQARVVLP